MSEEITVEEFDVERRLHTRHRATTQVLIRTGAGNIKCKAVNLSAGGVGVKTDGLGLRVGDVHQLAFAINLGAVTKIHRRTATVKYVRNGVTGFHMKPYEGK